MREIVLKPLKDVNRGSRGFKNGPTLYNASFPSLIYLWFTQSSAFMSGNETLKARLGKCFWNARRKQL